jgi:hypothetical protein
VLGTGASIAFKAAYMRAIGGFDPTLGAGTLTQGGEDLFIFFQTVTRGYTIAYQPTALLYHLHRRSYADLRKQMYGYGVGLTAYLTKSLFDQPMLLFYLIKKLPYGIFFAFSTRSPKNNRKSSNYPKELTKLELQGMLYGPLAYLSQSLTRLRNSRKQRHLPAPQFSK